MRQPTKPLKAPAYPLPGLDLAVLNGGEQESTTTLRVAAMPHDRAGGGSGSGYWPPDKAFPVGGVLHGESVYSKHFYRAQFPRDPRPQQHIFNELSRGGGFVGGGHSHSGGGGGGGGGGGSLPDQRRLDSSRENGSSTARFGGAATCELHTNFGRPLSNKKVYILRLTHPLPPFSYPPPLPAPPSPSLQAAVAVNS